MKTFKSFTIGCLIGIFIMGAVFRYRKREPVVRIVPTVDPNYVMPPCEAQRRLKEQGFYNGKIDNIWGAESDRAYCDWCAVKEIEECEK